ncbi:unnamed protein product [Meganyctiphanes norvegica]|uniref:Uncharacterized protein n=1 Tax=Meganyctiphanes norvegica TaxID=48144 RepID=A0AAV2RCJ5_MEGNR
MGRSVAVKGKKVENREGVLLQQFSEAAPVGLLDLESLTKALLEPTSEDYIPVFFNQLDGDDKSFPSFLRAYIFGENEEIEEEKNNREEQEEETQGPGQIHNSHEHRHEPHEKHDHDSNHHDGDDQNHDSQDQDYYAVAVDDDDEDEDDNDALVEITT